MENDCSLTIENLASMIRRREVSPVELTQFLLERISRLQPAMNAYITVTADSALFQARQAEKEIAKGRYRGILHGIPISVKDLFFTRDIPTTAGSRILRRFVPKENALVVDRLLRAGCILLGKTNLHEFAYGPTNINPHYGPVRNPWNKDCISGGSSGGSAASVVSAQAIASLGTDTGGSIRIPAAACGCVGFKPSFGRIPLDGVIPLAASLDHAGPLARCVMDAAHLYEAIANPGAWDCGSRRALAEIRKGVKSLRIGVPIQYFFDRIQPDVRKAIRAAISKLKELGAEMREVHLKGMGETNRLAAEITGDEALAYHSKWLEKKPHGYGKDVRIRLSQSRTSTATAYIQARQAMIEYGKRLAGMFDTVDVLLAPTLPVVAPRINQTEIRLGKTQEDVRTAMLRLTRPANLSGLPAISVPCGFSSDGLPIGLQIIGRFSDEITVLRAACAYESATPWHGQFPPETAVGRAK